MIDKVQRLDDSCGVCFERRKDTFNSLGPRKYKANLRSSVVDMREEGRESKGLQVPDPQCSSWWGWHSPCKPGKLRDFELGSGLNSRMF